MIIDLIYFWAARLLKQCCLTFVLTTSLTQKLLLFSSIVSLAILHLNLDKILHYYEIKLLSINDCFKTSIKLNTFKVTYWNSFKGVIKLHLSKNLIDGHIVPGFNFISSVLKTSNLYYIAWSNWTCYYCHLLYYWGYEVG